MTGKYIINKYLMPIRLLTYMNFIFQAAEKPKSENLTGWFNTRTANLPDNYEDPVPDKSFWDISCKKFRHNFPNVYNLWKVVQTGAQDVRSYLSRKAEEIEQQPDPRYEWLKSKVPQPLAKTIYGRSENRVGSSADVTKPDVGKTAVAAVTTDKEMERSESRKASILEGSESTEEPKVDIEIKLVRPVKI